MSTIVVKFGGSVFKADQEGSTTEKYHAVAEHLEDLARDYAHVLAVVSAEAGVSNLLIADIAGEQENVLNNALLGKCEAILFENPAVSKYLLDGELDSVDRLVEISGGRFRGLTQLDPEFPVVANSSYLYGEVYLNRSRQKAQRYRLEEGVTVISGYGGRDLEGNVALLGRNATDYVAALFAHLFNADTLRYYKDVPGIFVNFGTEREKLLPKVTHAQLSVLGQLEVLDSRVLDVPYNKEIEIYQFGRDQPGTVIQPDFGARRRKEKYLVA